METRTILNYLSKSDADGLVKHGNDSRLASTYGLRFKAEAMIHEAGTTGQWKILCEAETPEMANLGKGYIIGIEEMLQHIARKVS